MSIDGLQRFSDIVCDMNDITTAKYIVYGKTMNYFGGKQTNNTLVVG